MPARPQATAAAAGPMVIIGGGAAAFAGAEMLRREGYAGDATIVSAVEAPPYDRPNLSKDYLAGTAPEEWIPLRSAEFYAENSIKLRLGTTATPIDMSARRVALEGGATLPFEKLLLATGAESIRLSAYSDMRMRRLVSKKVRSESTLGGPLRLCANVVRKNQGTATLA